LSTTVSKIALRSASGRNEPGFPPDPKVTGGSISSKIFNPPLLKNEVNAHSKRIRASINFSTRAKGKICNQLSLG